MIGVVPSGDKTFEVYGSFETEDRIEGKIYYDLKDNRFYMYSIINNRPNPETGYFPVWNGKSKFDSKFAKKKYYPNDMISVDIGEMVSNITYDTAKNIKDKYRRSESKDNILKPIISDGDNMFTQCVKGTINELNVSMIDLYDRCQPKMPIDRIENFYSSLKKIAFMRYNKWLVWIDAILRVRYVLTIYKGNKKLLEYRYPEDKFDTGIVNYDDIIKTSNDSFKKIVKILIIMENIKKSDLKNDDIDDYTINNLYTSLSGDKPLSSQLFSRFMRISNLSYCIKIYDNDRLLFEFSE